MDDYEVKSPEQIVIDDVIPNWGVDLVVTHVIEVWDKDLGRRFRVTFADKTFALYPVGVAVKVIS